jgi:hypothetical protein
VVARPFEQLRKLTGDLRTAMAGHPHAGLDGGVLRAA